MPVRSPHGNISLINTEGGQSQAIVNDGKSGGVDWSPDGNKIVFYTALDQKHGEENFLDVRTGKRSAVPGLNRFSGARWIGDGELVAAGEESTL